MLPRLPACIPDTTLQGPPWAPCGRRKRRHCPPAFAGGQAVFPGCSPGGGRYPAIAEGSCSASVPAQRAGFRSPLSLPQLRLREREARRGQGQGAHRPLVPEALRPRPPVSSSPPFRVLCLFYKRCSGSAIALTPPPFILWFLPLRPSIPLPLLGSARVCPGSCHRSLLCGTVLRSVSCH